MTINFQLLNDAGIILSANEKSLLRISVSLLQKQNNLNYIMFWGKINGIKNEYYIIKGWNEFLGDGKYFYSVDCQEFTTLPPVDDRVEEFTHLEQAMFVGDPTLKIRFRDLTKLKKRVANAEEGEEENAGDGDGKEEEEEEAAEEEAPAETPEEGEEDEEEAAAAAAAKKAKKPSNFYTEDKRLAVVVKEIDHFACIVPKGYLFLSATHVVRQNKEWEGLTQTDALKLSSYFHQRFPKDPRVRDILETKGLVESDEFLDSVDKDEPIGTWSLQYLPIVSLVFLRSFLFPGFVFFLRPGTTEWGHAYVGNGLINVDLPFALPADAEHAFVQPKLLGTITAYNEEERIRRQTEQAKSAGSSPEKVRLLPKEKDRTAKPKPKAKGKK